MKRGKAGRSERKGLQRVGGTGDPPHPSYSFQGSDLCNQFSKIKKLYPEPNVEDWDAYLRSVKRNGTEWGSK